VLSVCVIPTVIVALIAATNTMLLWHPAVRHLGTHRALTEPTALRAYLTTGMTRLRQLPAQFGWVDHSSTTPLHLSRCDRCGTRDIAGGLRTSQRLFLVAGRVCRTAETEVFAECLHCQQYDGDHTLQKQCAASSPSEADTRRPRQPSE
jgi:hypothetical protein